MKTITETKEEAGEFCNIFGDNPRNRILEFFLEIRSMDYSIGDISKELNMNRATAYNIMAELVDNEFIIPARKVSGTQLYKLNQDKKEVKVLIETFNKILKRITE